MPENEVSFPGRSSLNVYGGGLAAVHSMGAIKFLLPRSKINFIEGVSAGALVTAILISNDFNVEKVIEIWLEIDQEGPAKIFRGSNIAGLNIPIRNWLGKSFYKNDGIKEIIDKYVSVEKIMAWEGEYIVVAENLTRGRKMPFSNKDERFQKNPGLFKSAILASASLRVLLPPVLIEGEWYSDGFTCSLVASLEREIDNIFIILSSRLDEGAGEHHENDRILDHMIGNTRSVVRDKIMADIKHAKRSGWRLIEQNPTDLFDDVKPDRRLQAINLLKDAAEALNPLSSEPIEERAIGQRKVIIFTPTNAVKTLKTDQFNKGDMKIAIERTIKEVGDFAQELAKQL